MRHTEEAKARIGAAARARNSAAIANAANAAAAKARRDALPPNPPKPEKPPPLTEQERKALAVIRAAEWAAKNREKSKAIKRAWYERHREEINAKQREKNKDPERKAFMREYAPKHRAANPDLYLTYGHNRKAKLLGAGTHTEKEWLAKAAAYGGACCYCGRLGPLARDHDIPLARGGANTIDNIVPACGSCNSKKGTLTGAEFRRRLVGEGPSMDERWAQQLARARQC